MQQQHAHVSHVSGAHWPTQHAVEVRVAALVRQRRRRDGVREFVAALTVTSLLVVGAVAYQRGTPPKPAAPAPAPAAAVAAAKPAA